jgi:hypothetical protein
MQFSPPSRHFISLWSKNPPQITEATTGPLYQPWMMMMISVEQSVERELARETEVLRVSLFPQTPHDLTRARPRAAAVGSRRFRCYNLYMYIYRIYTRCRSRVLIVYNIQNHWVSRLCPSSGITNNYKTQRFGNWISFHIQVKGGTHLPVCWYVAHV